MKIELDFKLGNSLITIDETEAQVPLEEILGNISDNGGYFDSGILPIDGDGLVSIRQGFGRLQFVYQYAPQIHRVFWGQRESDKNKPQYMLAEPYKIIVADFQDDTFLGLRHFYTFEPIYNYDIPLYAINLPNTNTTTYNGTSVGWVCLYLRDISVNLSLAQKINYVVERESGANEPYNNNNMSGTDGPSFYKARNADKSIWDPETWAERTEKEGLEWILNPELFTQIKIDWDTYPAAESHSNNGEFYNLGDALYKPYFPYYPGNNNNVAMTMMNRFHSLEHQNINPFTNKEFIRDLSGLYRTGKSAQPAANPTKLSPLKVLELAAIQLKIPQIKKDVLLSDGIFCPACTTKRPATTIFRNVVTSYTMEFPPYHNAIQRLDSFTINELEIWCKDCIDSRAVVVVDIALKSRTPVANFLVKYSISTNSWHLPETSIVCPTCTQIYPLNQAQKWLTVNYERLAGQNPLDAYINRESIPVADMYDGCINCVEAFVGTQLVDYSDVLQLVDKGVNLLAILPENVEELIIAPTEVEPNKFWEYTITYAHIQSFDPNAVMQITGEVQTKPIPINLARALDLAICPCGMFSNNTDVCDKCVDEEGCYTPQMETLVKISSTI